MFRPLTVAALLAIALAGAAGAQGSAAIPVHKDPPAQAAHSHEHTSGWAALDAYHRVMMDVWHPAKATGDLAPIRARSGALAAHADVLAAAAVPPACDRPGTRAHVAQIARDSRSLDALVARDAPDREVKPALAALHDRFELLNRGCTVPAATRGH